MSYHTPGNNPHRGRNLLFGDVGAVACYNGPTWTGRTNGSANASRRLKLGNGVLLTFGGAANNASILRSTDRGITYGTVNIGAGVQDWNSAAYGNGTWVLLAGLRVPNATVATSIDDGATWAVAAMPAAGTFNDVKFANGIFLALDSGLAGVGTAIAYTSPDGLVWTAQVLDRVTEWNACAYSVDLGYWLAASKTTADRFVSKSVDNGVTWTATTSILAGSGCAYLSWQKNGASAGLFFDTPLGSNSFALWSLDGVAWATTAASLGRAAPWSEIVFGDGVFVTANGGNELTTSKNGKTDWRNALPTPPKKLPATGGFNADNVWSVVFVDAHHWAATLGATTNTATGLC